VCQNWIISFPTQFFVRSAGLLNAWAKGLHKRWENIKVHRSLQCLPSSILFCSILFLLKVYSNMWMFSGHWMTHLDILLTVHLSIIYLSLFPTWYTVFRLCTISAILLSSTCFRPHRPIIRRSKLYMQPTVFSPSADVFVVRPLRKNSLLSQRPHDKDICRGGEYHRLHVQFRLPDDGPVRSETCRGK